MSLSKNTLFGILVSVLVAVIVTTFLFRPLDQEELYLQMTHRVRLLHKDWKAGKENWICGEFFDPDIRYEKVYLQCNTNLLKCKLQREKFLQFKKIVGVPERSRSGIVFTYRKNRLKRDFIFYDICKGIELPQRVYGLGEFNPKNDFKWDNKNRRILFDRRLVTRHDILNWPGPLDDKRREELRTRYTERELLHYPAHGLSLEEMKSFCRFHGKKLMEAHVWDAAAFMPSEIDNPEAISVVRTPYFWMKGKTGSFLENREENRPLTSEDCTKAYVQECHEITPLNENIYGLPSWNGMFQILGGSMEILDNIFRPRRNLIISSRELSRNSPWHRIGRRGYWDGKGWDVNNMSFGRWKREDGIEAPLKIAFRCMKYD